MTYSGSNQTVDYVDILEAADRLEGMAIRTPVISNPALNDLADAEVFLKAENLQRTGAFKFRGAFNAIRLLDEDERKAGVVAFSSGNHAQAVALAATICGTSAVIVMPSDASPQKRANTEANGATVVEHDRYTEDWVEIAADIAAREGRVLISPYDHPHVIAGQGTVGLELVDEVPDLDAIVVCVGGGGLLAGCSLAARAKNPSIRMLGVEPETGNDHALSASAGERVTIPVPLTIADGQLNRSPGTITWPINENRVEAFPLVSDAEIVETMKLLFTHAKLVVEPSGASALAALLHRDLGLTGKRVGVTLSGGNIGIDRFEELCLSTRAPDSSTT